jgi:hypothetical protein
LAKLLAQSLFHATTGLDANAIADVPHPPDRRMQVRIARAIMAALNWVGAPEGMQCARLEQGTARSDRQALGCALAVIALLAAQAAHAGLGTATEFYNPKNNHYFLTANPAEAAALDAGTNVKGWTRTGGQFSVFTEPAEALSAVCRFFGTPGKGPDSHFYTGTSRSPDGRG